jgi:hypothetical protein
VLAHGFARARCQGCGHTILVGFSCKCRGFCPSCTSRRSHDSAAHLTDRVFDDVPIRQWVLTFPRRIRYHLARHPDLVTAVLKILHRALNRHYLRAAEDFNLPKGKTGAVTFIQRFGSALNLNVHFHVMMPDGIFADPEGEEIAPFYGVPRPKKEEVQALLFDIAGQVIALLNKRFADIDAVDFDDDMTQLMANSVNVGRLPRGMEFPESKSNRLCANLANASSATVAADPSLTHASAERTTAPTFTKCADPWPRANRSLNSPAPGSLAASPP